MINNEICYKNVGLDSSIVSELFYQIYYMGTFRAPGEDYELYKEEEKQEPTPDPDPTPPTPPVIDASFDLSFDMSFAI